MHDPVEKRPAYFHKVHPRVYTRPLLFLFSLFLVAAGKGEEASSVQTDFYTTVVIFKPDEIEVTSDELITSIRL